MEDYISLLSTEQKNLLRSVEKCRIAHVINSMNQCPNFMKDAMFSYVLSVAALHRGYKPISILLIKKRCNVRCVTKTNYYNTPLYYAIKSDDMSIFEELFRRGASICDVDANNETPLELALQEENSEFWYFIISKLNYDNLDPNCKEHVAIFHAACFRGDVSIMKKFVERNFSVNSHSDSQQKEWTGATPLQIALKNRWYAREAVTFLLHFNIDFNAQDAQGNTPLHSLLERLAENPRKPDDDCVYNILRSYLKHYDPTKFNNPVNHQRVSHFHVLCAAEWDEARRGDQHAKLMKLLEHFIERGVDINSSSHFEKDENNQIPYYAGYTALHWAARKSRPIVLNLLLESGADPTKTDAAGNTPLHVLDFESEFSFKMAELLLNYGASVDVKNFRGDTPLHCAFYAQKRYKLLMQLLLSASHEVTDQVNSDGLTYLHIASSRDLCRVKILIENGALVTNRTRSDRGGINGYSALHFAVMFNRAEIVDYLLAHGAEVNPSPGECETTPLHLACLEQLKYFYNLFVKYDECVVRILTNCEEEAIDWAKSRKNQTRILEMLLEHGASVDTRDSHGMRPLVAVWAFQNSMISKSNVRADCISKEIVTRQKLIIDILLQHGADVNSRENDGRSLLHILLENSGGVNAKRDLISFLLSRGANVDAVDNDGCTVLHFTVMESSQFCDDRVKAFNYSSLIDLLLEYGANVNSRCKKLRTPLHLAVNHVYEEKDDENILMKFLNHPDIEIDPRDSLGHTPLYEAIELCKVCCVRKLLDAGADVSVVGIISESCESPISHLHRTLKDPFYRPNTDRINICVKVIEHVKKLMKLNYFVSDKVKMHSDSIGEFIGRDFSTTDSLIVEEVEKLKTVKLDSYTSLFDILIKDPNNMAKHVKNNSLEKIITSPLLHVDFPLFFGFLERQFRRGLSRSRVLEPAKKALRIVTRTNLPDSCSELILTNLDDNQLKLLVQCTSVK